MNDDGTARKSLATSDADRSRSAPPEIRDSRGLRRWRGTTRGRVGATGWDIDGNTSGSGKPEAMGVLSGDEKRSTHDGRLLRQHGDATASRHASTSGSGPAEDIEDTGGGARGSMIDACNNGEGDISKGGPVAASAGGGLQSRCSRNRCEQNPIAAPKDLVEAMAFVRPRVQAVRFAYRSVAEDMRREVKQRRERQLRKAQELQEQLRNQTVEELWPATAAQIRRRERLQALSRRPRDLNADHSRQSSSDGLLLSLQSPPQGGEQMLQMHRQDAAPMNPPIRPWQPGHDEQRAVGSLASAQATTIAEMAIRAELDVAALATSSVPAGGGSPVRPTSPITNHQAAATMQPETAPFHDFPADESPSLEATGQREVVLAGPQRVPRIGRALSPERLPHFMAGTHLTLCNLVSPTSTAVAVKALAAAPTSPVPTDARPGEPHQQVLPRQASYALVEKRAPAVSFSPIRQGQQPQPRYSREPGPGHYDPDVADGTLSRLTRSPATVFGTARRDLNSSPTRHGCGSGTVAVAADIAWLDRDPATALDFTRRRVPTALILPEAAATTAPPSAGGDEGTGQSMLLDVRFTLVEPRVRGTPAMRKPQPPVVQVSDEDGELLERITGPTDPWAIDLATRPRRPAWGFPLLGHAGLIQSPVSRHLLDLRPVYGLVHRRVAGAPDFARTLERNAGDAERLRRLRRQPGIGEYDMEMAWSYLCRRAPQILMRLAAPRWREEDRVQGDSDGAVEVRQQQQALLELSQALDYIRPQPPAWTFAPVVRVVRHDPADPRVRGVGFGPLLSWDVNLVLVRRRLPGALPFDVGGPRRATLLDSRVLEAVRHLAPGYYEAEQAWRTAQPRPRVADFSRGFGRVADTDAPPSPDEKADLPHGTRLSLDAVAAKDATLPRRDRGAPAPMALALGRSKALPADPAYDGRTTHLPLPNPDLDLPIRPRVRNVVLEGTPGHRPLAPELSPTDALRGPGAYFPADADQALAALGPAARMVDFGRGPERDTLLGRDRLNATEVLEGNRLVLSPHMALDFVRTRPRAALIQPPHPYSAGASQDLPYLHALYDVDPGLGLLLRRAPGQLEFGTRPGRDLPLAWPAGIDPADPPYSRAVAWLGVDDVPLTQLAGFRRAPGAPDFARTRPRTPQEKGDSKEQRLLDLDPDAARDRLRRQPRRPPNLALGGGHVDPTGAGPDRHLTAWLSYRPRLDAIRRHLVPPLDVPMACQIDRDQALKADPRVGDNATGDLDGGVYRVRYRLVQRSAPVIDFGHDTGAGMRTGLAPGAVPVDLDAGNVLLLEPRLPTGWRPPLHSAGSPTRQPFGRGEGRWERPGADPAYRFLSAVGDEGPALYLRYSADNLALLRRRATAANTPAAAWGWMTSRRDAQVMQPDPARAPRPRLPSPATSRVATQLLQQLRPPSSELELLKNNLANDPRVVAIRRRDRVLQRMLDKIKAQRAALADI
ncbi:hypothetical protein Vretifemale_17172 [Volvox reticuliferus]|uniref:Uncharacterized protein n=1 Tax=Volvox reticuliferus TaxID=1737510 RepID=A0A8J4CT72_9CHLO|nr:hypothetical protein Vretifemale_17172 [Volvox reticuliferus]